jgi:4-hydroxy-tetrahydrodipicolinate reductase
MLFLVLGKGKTGSLVAEVAAERGHGVRALEIHENRGASALTGPTLAGVDAVIDFTSPDSAVENMRAAELAKLDGYAFSITETHHVTKLDAPSGTALTLKEIIQHVRPEAEVEIGSQRIADAKGEHIITAKSEVDELELRHDAFSRRGFAIGAVRGAEWLAQQKKPGAWDFREIFDQL